MEKNYILYEKKSVCVQSKIVSKYRALGSIVATIGLVKISYEYVWNKAKLVMKVML